MLKNAHMKSNLLQMNFNVLSLKHKAKDATLCSLTIQDKT